MAVLDMMSLQKNAVLRNHRRSHLCCIIVTNRLKIFSCNVFQTPLTNNDYACLHNLMILRFMNSLKARQKRSCFTTVTKELDQKYHRFHTPILIWFPSDCEQKSIHLFFSCTQITNSSQWSKILESYNFRDTLIAYAQKFLQPPQRKFFPDID